MPVGPNIQFQSAEGFQAAVMPIETGLYIVAEMPTPTVAALEGAEIGVAPIIWAAIKKLLFKKPKDETEKAQQREFRKKLQMLALQKGGELDINNLPAPPFMDRDDADELGLAPGGCRCRRGQGCPCNGG